MLEHFLSVDFGWFVYFVVFGGVNIYMYNRGYNRGYKDGGNLVVNEWRSHIRARLGDEY